MNFVANQTKLKKLLSDKSGCYVYTRDKNDKTFKIGMSESSLFRRLRSAKSCYPYANEFWIHYIIATGDNGLIKVGETRSRTRELERVLLINSQDSTTRGKKITNEGTIEESSDKEQGIRPKEYRFYGGKSDLDKLIKDTTDLTPIYESLFVFSENDWKEYINLESDPLPVPVKPTKSGRKRKQTPFYADELLSDLFKSDINR